MTALKAEIQRMRLKQVKAKDNDCKESSILNDYLDLVEARVRDQDKLRLTHADVKKRYGLK